MSKAERKNCLIKLIMSNLRRFLEFGIPELVRVLIGRNQFLQAEHYGPSGQEAKVSPANNQENLIVG